MVYSEKTSFSPKCGWLARCVYEGERYKLNCIWQASPNNSNHWSTGWTEFSTERWPLSSNPAIERNADGRLEISIVGSDRQIYHKWQTTPGSINEWVGSWASLGGQIP
ncbi:MAG TPA: hypothetical protein VJ697_06250 [Nitrososphaeraceae archaeon]|nr:hypothetical protein [Nitrososphaeraceae archaeon]